MRLAKALVMQSLWPSLLAVLAIGLAVAGCTARPGPASPQRDPPSPGEDDDGYGPTWFGDDAESDDGSSWTAPTGPPPADDDASPPGGDASLDGGEAPDVDPPLDPAPDGACTGPPAAGDLQIDEMMIQSVAGSGDYGEWIEVRSTLACTVDLRGLHGECPSGAKVRVFDVTDDVWLPPLGTFVVADSGDRAIDHALPGTVTVWSGQPGDVLRNQGATVSLWERGALVDSVTYPALKLHAGASVAFPADCPASRRTDFAAWQTSTASWFPGFFGTPNAANLDVHCP
jgi:hypothetical protein